MLRKLVLPAATAMILVALGAGVQAVTIQYNGSVGPSAPNSAGGGYSFELLAGSSIFGTVVYDATAQDGLAWHINDNSITENEWWIMTPDVDFSHIPGTTVLARMKVLTDTHGAGGEVPGNVGVRDNDDGTGMQSRAHYGGPGNDVEETLRGISAGIGGDNGWHILRMTVAGRNYGKPAPWSDDFTYPDSALVGNDEWIGDAGSEISVTTGYVTLTHTPGSGYTSAEQLVLAGDNGSLNFSCKVKAGVEGAGLPQPPVHANMWRLYLRDPGGTELASWYGYYNSACPRITGTGAGTSQTLSGGWDTLRIHLDTTNQKANFWYTPEGGVEVLLNTLDFFGSPDSVLGIVELEHWDRGLDVTAGDSILFDDFSVTGGVVTENTRTIKMYLDENPTPVLTVSPAAPMPGAGETFMFGVDSDAAVQDIYFDWVIGNTDGAFAPGEEVAVLGQSFIPPAQTPVSTVEAAKTVADLFPVIIEDVVAASAFVDDSSTNLSFSIQHPGRACGIRVLTDQDEGFLKPGYTVGTIYGATDTVDGERVIRAGLLENVAAGGTAPDPLFLTNKASGGGAFGAQIAVVDDASVLDEGNKTTFAGDSFTYPEGSALVGNGPWVGNIGASPATVDHMEIVGGEVKIKCRGDAGSWLDKTASYFVTYPTTGPVECSIKMMPGVGAGGAYIGRFHLLSSNGREFGGWMYAGTYVKARCSGAFGSDHTLDPGGNILSCRIDFVARTTDYFIDGVYDTTLPFGPDALDKLDYVYWTSYDRDDTGFDYALFDDLDLKYVPYQMATGLNSIGLLTRISGKVTSVHDTGVYTDDFFYVDDGSGLNDGTEHPDDPYPPNIGIRCRHPYDAVNMVQMPMPDPDMGETDVTVTGVMGIQNGARFFWVQSWEDVTPL